MSSIEDGEHAQPLLFTLQTESGASSIWHMHSEWMVKNHQHQTSNYSLGETMTLNYFTEACL
eukprot:scaffold448_cov81-Skeletonema_dohrnii-CCMP3373.AAC.1